MPLVLGLPVGPAPVVLSRRLRGRLVVVTGASRGIGRELALRLAGVGARVVGVARSEDELAALARRARALPGGFDWLGLDLRDLAAADLAARRLVGRWGAPDVLVANAGHSIHRYLADYTDRFHDVSRTAGVNYTGAVAFALPLLAGMTRSGRGHVVAVSTTSACLPLPGWSAYTASKVAFDVWLRCVAPDLALAGVATTTVHLPRVATAMSAPTAGRWPVPELTVAQAADVLGHALVTRPRHITPWWARAADTARAAAPGLSHRLMQTLLAVGVRP
ncbi:MAG: SDR family NAD(P)-dependent oxidoreductase [Propionibacteriaceae bacterium]|jgi:NAD(P)-dependent dehydrogenase (short-subunit alcohol dehydrogenase family)|nr:SDR family NAD(P)-dependent oxidoreductase [Propionibacteriaceae bacterium]